MAFYGKNPYGARKRRPDEDGGENGGADGGGGDGKIPIVPITPLQPVANTCPEGVGPKAYEGCPCGEAYGTRTGNCAAGYKFVRRDPWTGNEDGAVYSEGMIGTCHCQKAISDWRANKGKGLGEYQWPKEMMDLYNRLMGRAGDILNMPYGYTQADLDKMFGVGFENVRAQEPAAREALLGNLGREGMLGTGAGLKKASDLSWGVEKNVSDVTRQVFLTNEMQKRQDMENYTRLVQDLFGGGMNYNTILEQINASRRGEGQNAMALFMQYLMQIINSWGR